MNISNVLQTEIVELIMKKLDKNLIPEENFGFLSQNSLEILMFEKHCKLVRKGVNIDIMKCLNEGKPVIIEGDSVNLKDYVLKTEGINDLNNEELNRQRLIIQKYIDNEIELKLNCDTIKRMNISQHFKDKFKIIVPSPILDETSHVKKFSKTFFKKKFFCNDFFKKNIFFQLKRIFFFKDFFKEYFLKGNTKKREITKRN